MLREVLYEDLVPIGWQANLELGDAQVDELAFFDSRTPGWTPDRADLIRSECSAILLILDRFDFDGKFLSLLEIAGAFGINNLVLGVPIQREKSARGFEKARETFDKFYRSRPLFESLLLFGW